MVDFEQLQTDLLALPQVNGIVPVDILSLPHELGTVVRGLVRDKTITSTELANVLEISELQARTAAAILVDKGYLLIVDEAKKVGEVDNVDNKVDIGTVNVGDQPSPAPALQDQDDADNDDPNKADTDAAYEYRIRFARMRKQRVAIDL